MQRVRAIDSELPNIPAGVTALGQCHLALAFRQPRKLHLKLGKRQASVRLKNLYGEMGGALDGKN
jgi:hypothetical protein